MPILVPHSSVAVGSYHQKVCPAETYHSMLWYVPEDDEEVKVKTIPCALLRSLVM